MTNPCSEVDLGPSYGLKPGELAVFSAGANVGKTRLENTYADGSPIVCELGESAESIENRRREALTNRIDQAEHER